MQQLVNITQICCLLRKLQISRGTFGTNTCIFNSVSCISSVLINMFHLINTGFKLRTFKIFYQNKIVLFLSDFLIQSGSDESHIFFSNTYIFYFSISFPGSKESSIFGISATIPLWKEATLLNSLPQQVGIELEAKKGSKTNFGYRGVKKDLIEMGVGVFSFSFVTPNASACS